MLFCIVVRRIRLTIFNYPTVNSKVIHAKSFFFIYLTWFVYELPLHAPKARVIPFHYTELTWLQRQDSNLRFLAYETKRMTASILCDILSILGKNTGSIF